jgi:hypothetical protein
MPPPATTAFSNGEVVRVLEITTLGVLLIQSILDVPDPHRHRVLRDPLVHVQRILLGLHPPTLTDPVPTGITLRDEVGDTGRLGGGQQMICPLRAQPVGGGDHMSMCLVHDRFRPGGGHHLTDRRGVQTVHHDAIGAQLRQQGKLAWVPGRRRHLVVTGHELRHPAAAR